jgi:hypothetical protein
MAYLTGRGGQAEEGEATGVKNVEPAKLVKGGRAAATP